MENLNDEEIEKDFYEEYNINILDENKDKDALIVLDQISNLLKEKNFDSLIKMKLIFGNCQWYSGQLSGEMESKVWGLDSNLNSNILMCWI